MKPNVPPLFKAIVENHNDLSALKANPVIDFGRAKQLVQQKRGNTRMAEKVLHWNPKSEDRKGW